MEPHQIVYHNEYCNDGCNSSIIIYKLFNGMHMVSFTQKNIKKMHKLCKNKEITSPYKILYKDITCTNNCNITEILTEMTVETPLNVIPEKIFEIIDV